jgi:heptosyltransferase II
MIKFTRNYLENFSFIILTFFLSPLLYCQTLINRFKHKDNLRILVIQTAKIGDLVCSTPVFREIKKKYPKSYLTVLVLCSTKEILKNNLHIDEIISIDHKKIKGITSKIKLIKKIKKRKFDWSFSLLPEILSNVIIFWSGIPNRVATVSKYATFGAKISLFFNNYKLEYKRHTLALDHYLKLLKFININNVSKKKEIFITKEQNKKATQFLKKYKIKDNDFLVGISVTAGNSFKEWSFEKFAQLADRLIKEKNAKIIFLGSIKDKEKIFQTQSLMEEKSLDASGVFSLLEVPALFKLLNLFISVDTGSLYIANAMGVPVIDIAGPVDINEQPPLGDQCVIVQKKLSCVPCSFILPPARKCKKRHRRCIESITVDNVWQAVKKILKLC